MLVLDGKICSQHIKQDLLQKVNALKIEGKRVPHLAAILVGNNGASETYVANKVKSCGEVGFQSTLLRFNEETTEAELLQTIEDLNNNTEIDGILVQLPLSKQISELKVIETISPKKMWMDFIH